MRLGEGLRETSATLGEFAKAVERHAVTLIDPDAADRHRGVAAALHQAKASVDMARAILTGERAVAP